jgi:hypothetical protein
VKDIRLESFLSDLLFIVIENEIQRAGFWAEGKGIMRCDTCGWDGEI